MWTCTPCAYPTPTRGVSLSGRDNPLAAKAAVMPEDLLDQPLISSRQGVKVGVLGQWLGDLADEMDVRATYNLPLNAKFLVRQGIGSAFTYRGLFEANELNDLAFVPLSPTLESTQGLVWRKTPPHPPSPSFFGYVEGPLRRARFRKSAGRCQLRAEMARRAFPTPAISRCELAFSTISALNWHLPSAISASKWH